MKNKPVYVTYRWALLGGNLSGRKAISCPSKEYAMQCAYDIRSIVGIRNVRINACGRLRKDTRVIPYESYVTGQFHKM